MGKAAERRRARRNQYLAKLAQEDPKRFCEEWNKRLDSWLHAIHRQGRTGDLVRAPLFDLVEVARTCLSDCGEAAVALELQETVDLLSHECARLIAGQVGPVLYRVSRQYGARS